MAPSKGHFNVTAQQPGSQSEQALPNTLVPKPHCQAARHSRTAPLVLPDLPAPERISKMENTSQVPYRHTVGGMASPLEMPSGPHTHTAVSHSQFTLSMWPQPPQALHTNPAKHPSPHRPPALPRLVSAARSPPPAWGAQGQCGVWGWESGQIYVCTRGVWGGLDILLGPSSPDNNSGRTMPACCPLNFSVGGRGPL